MERACGLMIRAPITIPRTCSPAARRRAPGRPGVNFYLSTLTDYFTGCNADPFNDDLVAFWHFPDIGPCTDFPAASHLLDVVPGLVCNADGTSHFSMCDPVPLNFTWREEAKCAVSLASPVIDLLFQTTSPVLFQTMCRCAFHDDVTLRLSSS